MNEVYEKLLKCYACFEDKIDFKPQAALILGSGLGDYADTNMKVEAVLDYHDIEGFPVSTVPGHKGRFDIVIIKHCFHLHIRVSIIS